jgi:hypothetical protein
MPMFTPPTEADMLRGQVDSDDPSDRLFRYYQPQEAGATVWKDTQGVWHQSVYPYQGGNSYRTFNNGILVSETFDDPDTAIATAQEVYLGGHTYEISEAKAAELIAAGFVIDGHFDSEEQKWIDYALTSDPNLEWKGGDAMASVANSSGQTAWTFADTLIGTVDAEGFYINALPVRNSCVIQDASGNITSQIYASGGAGPAFAHPSPGTNWYWPLDIAVNGPGIDDTRVIMALEMFNNGAFGTIVGNTMLTLNAFVGVVATTNYGNDNGKFRVYSVYNDTAFHYISATEQVIPAPIDDMLNTPQLFDHRSYTRLGRCPIGSLTNTASWEFWNGSSWDSSMSSAVRLKDEHNADIEGEATITKVGSDFIMGVVSFSDPVVRCYSATTPSGPWTMYYDRSFYRLAQKGLTPPAGRRFGYYQPKFHEHLNPAPNILVASYMRNTFNLSSDPGSDLSDIHVSTFAPNFVYLPTP